MSRRVTPRGTKAPKLWPADPRKVRTMLSSGSPAAPRRGGGSWRRGGRRAGGGQGGAEVETLGLVVVDGLQGVEQVDASHRLVQRAQAQRGQVLPHLLGD